MNTTTSTRARMASPTSAMTMDPQQQQKSPRSKGGGGPRPIRKLLRKITKNMADAQQQQGADVISPSSSTDHPYRRSASYASPSPTTKDQCVHQQNSKPRILRRATTCPETTTSSSLLFPAAAIPSQKQVNSIVNDDLQWQKLKISMKKHGRGTTGMRLVTELPLLLQERLKELKLTASPEWMVDTEELDLSMRSGIDVDNVGDDQLFVKDLSTRSSRTRSLFLGRRLVSTLQKAERINVAPCRSLDLSLRSEGRRGRSYSTTLDESMRSEVSVIRASEDSDEEEEEERSSSPNPALVEPLAEEKEETRDDDAPVVTPSPPKNKPRRNIGEYTSSLGAQEQELLNLIGLAGAMAEATSSPQVGPAKSA